MSDAVLMAVARRAYERGRFKRGVREAAFVLPLACLPLYQCMQAGRGAQMLAVIAALSVLIVLLIWRGEDYERGARVGLMAGLSPLLLPLLPTLIAPMYSAAVCELVPAATVAGGLFAGVCLAGSTLARPSSIGFWFSAIAVTATLGAAGCLHAGLAGLGSMALGLGAGVVPILAAHAIKAR